jgi:AcrR family transcriptional regulator
MASPHLKTPARFRAEDRRQQILETATQLFARQGYDGTTTRQIAERARVNEAIIFRHFPSKEELYWAVIEHKCREGHGRQIVAARLESGAPVEEVFAGIAEDFLKLRERDSTLTRLLLFSALEHHRLSQRFFDVHIAEVYETLAHYIRKQIQAGKFREVDPLLAARGFWGMVIYHFLIQELFGAKRSQHIDARHASRTLADIWLQGMLPHDGAEGNGRSASAPASAQNKPESNNP